jgi:arsenate reductase
VLQHQGVAFDRRDYFRDRFTVDELREVLTSAGLHPSEVLSKRAKAYKELIGDREVSDEEILHLIVREPTLLRRPLTVHRGRAIVGFDQQALAALTKE